MNKQIFIIIILFLISVTNITAIKCGDIDTKKDFDAVVVDYCSLESGISYQVYFIPVCEDEVLIKVRTKLSNTGFYFNEFVKQSDQIWTATCRNDMPIMLMTDKKSTNEFDIIIEYYIKEQLITDDKNADEAYNSLYRRILNFNNIRVDYKEEELNINIFDLEDMGSGLYLIIGIILIVVILLAFGGLYLFKLFVNDKKNVITGEKVSTKTLDMELKDILDDIDK